MAESTLDITNFLMKRTDTWFSAFNMNDAVHSVYHGSGSLSLREDEHQISS